MPRAIRHRQFIAAIPTTLRRQAVVPIKASYRAAPTNRKPVLRRKRRFVPLGVPAATKTDRRLLDLPRYHHIHISSNQLHAARALPKRLFRRTHRIECPRATLKRHVSTELALTYAAFVPHTKLIAPCFATLGLNLRIINKVV